MKIILFLLKVVRWALGILFSLVVFGLLLEKEFLLAFIFLIISLLLIPPILNFLFKKLNLDFNGFEKLINSINYSDTNAIVPFCEYSLSQRKKPFTDKQKRRIGKRIYSNALKNACKDFYISDDEIEGLNKIGNYFNLSKQDISEEKRKISEKILLKMIEKKYEDKLLTDSENYEIMNLANFLEFPINRVEEIKNKIALSIFNLALDEKISDRYLSPTEETELLQLIKKLAIDEQDLQSVLPNKKLKSLAYAKLLWNLENGIFTPLYRHPINLTRGESCYLGFNGTLLESKIVTKGYSHSSSSVSIKITKGVRYRVGSGRSTPIKQEVAIRNSGNLFLTSSRIVFTGGNKSFQIPFTKLLTYDVYRDGIDFIMERKNYLVQLEKSEVEIFAVGLCSAMRQFQNGNDETKLLAMKEIENNQTFINI